MRTRATLAVSVAPKIFGSALDFAACAADLRLTDNWTQDGKAFIVLSPGRRL